MYLILSKCQKGSKILSDILNIDSENTMNLNFNLKCNVFFKVGHSSAFQTTSVTSVYIKVINYSGRILASLNNTMKKQACNEITTLIFKYKQDILWTIFCGERIFSRIYSKT